LTAMSLIAMAKTQFGKTITGREVRSCKTVEELYNLISNK
jgi:acyl carrier protein